jgi:peptide/nickel transport system permease protein
MIPTLFGVTIVSFVVMQLAPGDPLLSKLDAQGARGESTQTREAYLIQKRDLHLDKPLLLNFRWFKDYTPDLVQAAYFRSRAPEQILEELNTLADSPPGGDAAARLEFLRDLDIREFEERLSNKDKRPMLAEALPDYVRLWCEDVGNYGVSDAMPLLLSEDTPLDLKVGLIRCLSSMVVEAHKYTFSRDPSADETPLVQRSWRTWWERNQGDFAEIPPERREALQSQLEDLAASSREERFRLLEEDYLFEREDMPFFVETLLGESTLEEKAISSIVLNLYISRPLQMTVPDGASAADVQTVIENWVASYEPRQSQYNPNAAAKAWYIIADTQYAHMVWRLATFNFGRSALKTREPVSRKLWDAFLISAPLMLMAELVIYFIAVPLGVMCAVNRENWIDRGASLVLFLLYSVPPFVAGMLFLLYLCYGEYLKLFPMGGLHSDGAENFGFVRWTLDYLWHAALPVVCLSLFSLAGLAMYSRSSMLDVFSQDYIRTARAKGCPERSVIYKHAFRNSLIPILTLFANFLPALLGGSVLIEYLFNIPGMGRLSWESIKLKDFPTLMALIYVQSIVVLLSILVTDILYVVVDPRITFNRQE